MVQELHVLIFAGGIFYCVRPSTYWEESLRVKPGDKTLATSTSAPCSELGTKRGQGTHYGQTKYCKELIFK